MSIVLLDTCVLTDLADTKSDWFEWCVSTLEDLDSENRFVINPIIYSEFSVGFDRIEEVEKFISALGLGLENIPKPALFLAGKAFLQYKRNRGSKSNVLPDFLIGAHAAVENFILMTRDKGRYATYFPTVELVIP